MTDKEDYLVEARDLTKVFTDFWHRPKLTAVNSISFKIKRGQVFGLLGPNGSGKSTTIKMMLGLLKTTSGELKMFGENPGDVKVKQHIGYLPESTPLYNDMRVREYLRYRARLKGVAPRDIDRRIEAVAERCWVSDFINRLIGQLSKGMRQRVGLADAMIHEPDILFLDEPTIGLDPTQIRQTRDLIAELGQRHTVMLSSHILSDIEALCSQVVIIASGRVVASGHPRELSAEVSQSSKLIAEIRGPDTAVTSAIEELAGVTRVESAASDDWCRLAIETGPRDDVREALFKLTAERGWSLREMRREVGNLEDYFVKIVASQRT